MSYYISYTGTHNDSEHHMRFFPPCSNQTRTAVLARQILTAG